MEKFFSILLVAFTTNARKLVTLDNNEWDSVVVTTSPVKITNSRFHLKNSTKDHAIRLNQRNARLGEDCEEGDLKCTYDNQLNQNPHHNPEDTIKSFLEKYSSVTNVKINQELRNNSPKAYWNQIDSEKHNHPYDDSKGWVTLEPIPWSSSKVSRWKPHQSGDKPWMFGQPQQNQLWISTNHHKDRPSAHWAVGSNDIITENTPNGFPLDDAAYPSKPQSTYIPAPVQKPPTLIEFQSPQHPSYSPTQQLNTHQTFKPPYQLQQNTVNSFLHHPHSQGSFQNPTNPTGRPPSYPEYGHGEWVLVSTTKGYSVPQRYYDRKMQVEGMIPGSSSPDIITKNLRPNINEMDDFVLPSTSIDVNRKSDNVELGKPIWNVNGINIFHTENKASRDKKSMWKESPALNKELNQEKTFKRTVRLTVLPPLHGNSTLSHNGMLEVDSNQQTVEEAYKEEERMKKLQQIAVVSSGRQPFHMVPVIPRGHNEEMAKKKATVLAAVGAGMIPATMAVLLPVTLGRRRRSISTDLRLRTIESKNK